MKNGAAHFRPLNEKVRACARADDNPPVARENFPLILEPGSWNAVEGESMKNTCARPGVGGLFTRRSYLLL